MKRIFYRLVVGVIKKAAHKLLKKKRPFIVGVTGSVGKSSFIYLLDALVKDIYRTKTTRAGNSEIGLPLEILGLRKFLHYNSLADWLFILAATPFVLLFNRFNYDLLIAELSIDSSKAPKNMEYLLEFIHPHIGVFLSVAAAHTQQFANELHLGVNDAKKILEGIAREKGKIVTQLNSSSHAIVNVDSPYIRELLPQIQAKIITFGHSNNADYRLYRHTVSATGTAYEFTVRGTRRSVFIRNAILPEEFGLIILAVLSTAEILKVPVNDAISSLGERFILPPGRMSLLPGKRGIKIIDSSYNCSPLALISVLKTMIKLPTTGKKIAILGDMRELGPLEAKSHNEIATLVSKAADRVYLVGPLMQKYLYHKLQKLKIPVETFPISKGLGDYLLRQKFLKEGDIVLVKGSQNAIFLEQAVLELMANPKDASQLLCRQSNYWDNTRKDFFNNYLLHGY